MEKFERLLNLVALLEARSQPLTAAEIRSSLGGYNDRDGAFRRTFERDKKDLLEMGVPLVVVKDHSRDPAVDAYTINHTRSPIDDPALTDDELLSLKLAATTMALHDEGVDDLADVNAALRKLGGLGGPTGDGAIGDVAIDAALVAVFDAIVAGRGVAFRYKSQARQVVPRQVLYRGGNWYVSGLDLASGEGRTFRTDRIEGTVLSFDADDVDSTVELDVLSFRPWEYGTSDVVSATVRLDADIAPLALREDPHLSATPQADGSVVVKLDVRSASGLWQWLLRMLDHAELLEPPALRTAYLDVLQELATSPAVAGSGS